jgi:hypothetical protein
MFYTKKQNYILIESILETLCSGSYPLWSDLGPNPDDGNRSRILIYFKEHYLNFMVGTKFF